MVEYWLIPVNRSGRSGAWPAIGQEYQCWRHHLPAMHEVRPSPDSSERITVLDELGGDCPITPAELDAIEAFLMPLVEELFGKEDRGPALADSAAPQNFAPV